MLARAAVLALSSAIAAACAPPAPPSAAPFDSAASARDASLSGAAPALELVESWPVETALDHADIRDASDVWLEMIDGARKTLDLSEFYAVTEPGSRLEGIVRTVEAAAARGVRVRFVVDSVFRKTYPDLPARLAAAGAAVRTFDGARSMGGVLHAKYFVVDGREAYLGSQNFDWRSLEHIQELGLRLRDPTLSDVLGRVFEIDWALAGGEPTPAAARVKSASPTPFPLGLVHQDEPMEIMPALSPKGYLPDPSLWDLPQLVRAIDAASRYVEVQLLGYAPRFRDGAPFPALDDALRRAAARGAAVRLLCADWSRKPGKLEPLQALAAVSGVEVRLVSIPRWSGGDIPFARVVHAKYMVVDDATSWVGTSNWEGDYFEKSRNVGLMVRSRPLATRLHRFFHDVWGGPYASAVR